MFSILPLSCWRSASHYLSLRNKSPVESEVIIAGYFNSFLCFIWQAKQICIPLPESSHPTAKFVKSDFWSSLPLCNPRSSSPLLSSSSTPLRISSKYRAVPFRGLARHPEKHGAACEKKNNKPSLRLAPAGGAPGRLLMDPPSGLAANLFEPCSILAVTGRWNTAELSSSL